MSSRDGRGLARQRAAMVARIVEEVRESADYLGCGKLKPSTLKALGRVPRHRFVPRELIAHAYADSPLPIGHGQTISQPFIVALMTDLADLERDSRVLEVGGGSGYQAAVLAELAGEVFSIEYIDELAVSAAARLDELGYRNVRMLAGDGYRGWPEAAPFDAILVTAAIPEPPPSLLEQLNPGGRLVIPLGHPGEGQQLTVLTRRGGDGQAGFRTVLPVAFVPFIHTVD